MPKTPSSPASPRAADQWYNAGVELVVANAEEKLARDRLTFAAWGEQLTPEQWLEREARLCAHPWARQAMTWWLWRGDDGAVLSSCETYRMRSAIDGTRGETWAVASVYTEPALRGRGHARRMMEAVVARARAAGAQASTLFSDVGAPIYEASGYVARPAYDLVFPPARGDAVDVVDALLGEVVEPDEPLDDFAIWPTAAQLDWHVERGRTYGALLDRPSLPAVGARAGRGVAMWAADWKHDRLLIIWLDAARPYEAEALVQAARRMARTLDLHEVRLWAQPWSFGGRDDLGGDCVGRIGSLPMIVPLSPSLRAQMWTQIPRAVWV